MFLYITNDDMDTTPLLGEVWREIDMKMIHMEITDEEKYRQKARAEMEEIEREQQERKKKEEKRKAREDAKLKREEEDYWRRCEEYKKKHKELLTEEQLAANRAVMERCERLKRGEMEMSETVEFVEGINDATVQKWLRKKYLLEYKKSVTI